eukprot:SAG31_NODE_2637_length_5336_cov_2.105977_2_plen_131_part_00
MRIRVHLLSLGHPRLLVQDQVRKYAAARIQAVMRGRTLRHHLVMDAMDSDVVQHSQSSPPGTPRSPGKAAALRWQQRLAAMTTQEIADGLASVGLGKFTKSVKAHGIDGNLCSMMDNEGLKDVRQSVPCE